MAARELELSAGDADFDGYVNLSIKLADGSIHRVEKIDVWQELNDIDESLNKDEKAGTAFLQAVRRYMLVKHGVKVSIFTARDYYNKLSEMMKDVEGFFSDEPESPGSTDSTSPAGQNDKSESTTDSSTASEPKNPSNA